MGFEQYFEWVAAPDVRETATASWHIAELILHIVPSSPLTISCTLFLSLQNIRRSAFTPEIRQRISEGLEGDSAGRRGVNSVTIQLLPSTPSFRRPFSQTIHSIERDLQDVQLLAGWS